MPRADATAIASVPTTVRGWGGGAGVSALLLRPDGTDAVRSAVALCRSPGRDSAGDGDGDGDGAATTGAIARGMGRSYGDAAQLSGGRVLDMTLLRGFQLDEDQGTVTAQAGVTIGQLLGALVPAGWMLPVVPGTQHVTVGGAIASDIHGKNHGTAGTFGSHVRALGLLTAEGEVLELEPGSDDGLFAGTVGGMGLTGVILWARIGLWRVRSSLLSVDTDRVQRLDDALVLLAGPGGPHRVAWLDLLGSRAGRGIVTRAEHFEGGAGPGTASRRDGPTVRARAAVPEHWPGGVLRANMVRAFNELRFRRAPRRERGRPEGLGVHMFPLDSLDAWPRLYGKQGLLQYQLVVPGGQEQVLHAVIERMRRGRVPCFLAVLKDLGAANDSPLSFPFAGWTLALDLPRAAPGIGLVLDGCDELVAEAGGRVYLTKDARLKPATVAAMYPRLEEWRMVRDRADPERLWRSDLALRTGLVEGER
jgi:decaprenylphospho-beta-D-ribofuranose 2-oxidase